MDLFTIGVIAIVLLAVFFWLANTKMDAERPIKQAQLQALLNAKAMKKMLDERDVEKAKDKE